MQALLDGGKLKALAVTSAKRSKFFPIKPTVAESGRPGWSVGCSACWHRRAEEIVDKLNQRWSRSWPTRRIEHMAKLGAEPEPQTPDAFARYINADVAKWSALVKEQGIVIPGAGK